ncbi:MAG: TolC family protein, partial [Deltaproteobacteria bacterium]|nr:TolC family protein [Deltaproteobacteria bacterium]
MWYRKFMFALLLAATLIMGCEEQYKAEVYQGRVHNIHETNLTSSFELSSEQQIETAAVTEPDGSLTLRRALALTLMNNPELRVFSLETRAAQARELQAGLWPNPELEVEVEEVGGTGDRRGFDAAETTVQLSQLIELGDKSQKRKKVASFEKELADIDYHNKKLEVFSEAAKIFIAVLQAQEKLQLSGELLKLSEESFNVVEQRVNAGKDSPLEKTRAFVGLSNIKIKHRETQRNLEFVRKELSSFWGQDKPLFEQAAGNLNDIQELSSLDELVLRLKLNPQYTRWETEIKKSRAVLDLEKSKAIGDLTIGGGLQRFNETDDNAFIFGVSIPLPVANRNQGAKQEAAYNLAKAREEQKAAWLKLQNEFNRTYQELTNSYSQATSLRNEVLPGALEVFNAATTAYREGKVDYLNVLDAQRTLF